jgi:hypothetical protein
MWKVNYDRRRAPSDGKSSHCLWQGELIKVCLTIELKNFLQTILFIYEYLIVRNNSFTQFELEMDQNKQWFSNWIVKKTLAVFIFEPYPGRYRVNLHYRGIVHTKFVHDYKENIE